MMRPLRASFLIVGILCAGCSAAKEETTVPVAGQVTVKGQPLETGRIVFIPDGAKGNNSKSEPRGKIEAGKFKLTSNNKDGAAPGWYVVTVFAMKEPASSVDPEPTVWLANQRYTDPKTSGLSVEVVEKPGPDAYNFSLEP